VRASIVLAVRDEAEQLFRSLSTLARLPDEPRFEVIVVDDASSDGTTELLSGVEGDFQSLRNELPAGYGPACDQAVAAARGDAVVLLSEQLVPTDGWLEPLLTALEQGAGAVRPRTVDLSGADVDGPLWPCLALRRDAYERVGGFAGTAQSGRAEKVTLVEALEAANLAVVDEPGCVMLDVPVERDRAPYAGACSPTVSSWVAPSPTIS
jgi:glycosyltransferase involved in cell wall biosynthesis